MESPAKSASMRSAIKRSLASIDRQWPSVKFCSLGFYSAWILLMMGGTSIPIDFAGFDSGAANSLLYLSSGVPLTLTLIVCGLAARRVERYFASGPLVPLMALLTSVCTFLVVGGLCPNIPTFVAASAGTGIGTAFLCLRIGRMYSTLDSARVLFTTFGSALVANLLYFTCVAASPRLSLVLLSLFPLCAIVVAQLRPEEVRVRLHDEEDVAPSSMLPKGFLARCMAVVAVITVAVGITRGIVTISIETQELQSHATASVFASFFLVVALMIGTAVVNGIKRFDLSRLYYPLIVAVACICLLSPLLGAHYLWLQGLVMSVAYNLLTLVMWCLFANIAGQTDFGAVRVFGLGRGASAFGNTFGQLIAAILAMTVPGAGAYSLGIGVASAIVVLVAAMLVFDERTVRDALAKTYREASEERMAETGQTRVETWNAVCEEIASEHELTAREREIFLLLGKGRTATYIAETLGIAYNTTKGHIRNIYAKCDAHSRQEIIDLIDARMG